MVGEPSFAKRCRICGRPVSNFSIFMTPTALRRPSAFLPGHPPRRSAFLAIARALNVYSGYLAGSLFEFDRNMLLYSQLALERNDAVNRRVEAAAWYVEPGYQ